MTETSPAPVADRTPGVVAPPPCRAARSLLWGASAIIMLSAISGGVLVVAKRLSGLNVNEGLIAGAMAVLAGVAAGVVFLIDRHQNQLMRDRQLMAEMMEDAQIGRAICRPDGALLHGNAAFWRMLAPLPDGMPHPIPEQALTALFRNDPERAAEFARVLAGAKTGRYGACELFRKISGDASVQCLFIEAWPSPRHACFITWRVEDITPRVHVQEAIRAEQARWVDFVDHAPVGFFSVNEEGAFTYVNGTLARWLGGAVAEVTDGTLKLHRVMVKPPEGGSPWDLSEGGAPLQQGEFTFKSLTGRSFQALVAQTVSHVEGGVRTRAVVHDLTPEREWQAALQASQARFHRFFEESPTGVALVAESGVIAECNPTFLRMVGNEAAQMIAQPIGAYVTGLTMDLGQRLARVAAGEDFAAPIEVKLKGQTRDIPAQLYARRLTMGDVTGARLILHFIDLTEQKSLEVRFAQSQKMQAIGQLAGGVAHDFNNLLTAISGFSDLLLLRHKPGDASFSDIMQIKQNSNRAAGLVRQLLAFSRQQTLQPKVLNVTDVLMELSNLLRRLIGENIELKFMHGRDLGLIKADQGQIEQVITNLAVNARDAMGAGGKLTITTSNLKLTAPMRREAEEVPAGEWVVLEVADTGTGIPLDIVTRIFDPFFSTKEVGKGTGLGLSTCYGIVKQTGGAIFVDTEMGQGTKFSIFLPRHVRTASELAAAEKGEIEAAAAPIDLTGAGTILLVEDEDAVRMFAARALKNKGYQVVEARSGDHAVEVLAAHTGPLDLVISDVMMPGMDGPTLMKKIKADRPDLRAIFISGYSEERLKETFDSDAAETIHFLPKPFSLKQLAEKVKDVMQG